MKRKIFTISLLFSLVITLLFSTVTASAQQKIADKVIRLHVVANSDLQEDQARKLRVRDAILTDVEPILEEVTDRDEAAERLSNLLPELAAAAEDCLQTENCALPVCVSLTTESFPTREYDTFSLPAGDYLSLRVVLGEGNGHNWWCVVYPALCRQACLHDASEELGLSEGEMHLISGENASYKISFRLLELLQKLRKAGA